MSKINCRCLISIVLSIIVNISATAKTEGFFTEGKRWVFEYYDSHANESDELDHNAEGEYVYTAVYVGGDTIVDGKNAKKIVFEEELDPLVKDLYKIAVFEEEGVIYYHNMGKRIPYLDFSVSAGDNVPVWDAQWGTGHLSDEPDLYYHVLDDKTINLYGIERRILTLRIDDCGGKPQTFYWIEGIGVHTPGKKSNIFYIFLQYPGGCLRAHGAIECYQGDELIYSRDDFENQMALNGFPLAEISKVTADDENEMDSSVYDMMGRRVKGIPSPGLYII